MSMPWNTPEVVARFSVSSGNTVLQAFAEKEFKNRQSHQALDIGCGAGSNAIPLARIGWNVTGLDLAPRMVEAATQRAKAEALADKTSFRLAPMDLLPIEDQSQDMVIAHGIWNLAASGKEFRAGVQEAARVARPGAALFVFTFSRKTIPETCIPVDGETFVFTEFADRPQCFLTQEQLIEEMAAAGFEQEPGCPITEYPQIPGMPKPALLEGIFRRR
ncbi:class I SAM-dependent methyltransferase [Pontiellaceae bacterium B12219]|nr:class I SAM-dependent methyltransferase [Pontiellaceae bacterium B12219]